MLQAELARLRAGGAMEPLDLQRCLLEPPPLEKRNDFAAWKKALDNAHSQLEHQYNRCSCASAPFTGRPFFVTLGLGPVMKQCR